MCACVRACVRVCVFTFLWFIFLQNFYKDIEKDELYIRCVSVCTCTQWCYCMIRRTLELSLFHCIPDFSIIMQIRVEAVSIYKEYIVPPLVSNGRLGPPLSALLTTSQLS